MLSIKGFTEEVILVVEIWILCNSVMRFHKMQETPRHLLRQQSILVYVASSPQALNLKLGINTTKKKLTNIVMGTKNRNTDKLNL